MLNNKPKHLKKIPQRIVTDALNTIKEIKQGTNTDVKLTGKFKYTTCRVRSGYRLLSKDGGKTFALLSHQDYNRVVDQ